MEGHVLPVDEVDRVDRAVGTLGNIDSLALDSRHSQSSRRLDGGEERHRLGKKRQHRVEELCPVSCKGG